MLRNWKQQMSAGLLLAGLAGFGWAQEGALPAATTSGHQAAGARGRGGFGFLATLERAVGLNAEQRDAVRGLLATQRQKTEALRRDTDGKIRGLLTAEQQKKFDVLRAEQQSRRNRGQR
jgi:hypothetical protein